MEKNNTKKYLCGVPARTFRFEFGTDDGIWSASFKGIIPEQEVSHMIEDIHRQSYAGCAEAIRSYLDTHRLEYWDFTSVHTRLEHDTVMKLADSLLYVGDCERMDERSGNADVYYSVMDYQCYTGQECYEGCYYAVSRTFSMQEYPYEYHIICQKFQYDISGDMEQSRFAIRRNEGGHRLHTLDQADGQPVLPVFGCIDMLRLLANIQGVTKRQQAVELAANK